jgi:hypothetical protein
MNEWAGAAELIQEENVVGMARWEFLRMALPVTRRPYFFAIAGSEHFTNQEIAGRGVDRL